MTDEDLAAYKRMREDGLRPPGTANAADLERRIIAGELDPRTFRPADPTVDDHELDVRWDDDRGCAVFVKTIDGWAVVGDLVPDRQGTPVIANMAISPVWHPVKGQQRVGGEGGVNKKLLSAIRPVEIIRDAARILAAAPGRYHQWQTYFERLHQPEAAAEAKVLAERVERAGPLKATPRVGRPRLSQERLREIALAWIALEGTKAPRRAMCERFKDPSGDPLEENTLKYQLKRARDEGWLAKGPHGAATHQPGPRLVEWMTKGH